MTDYERHWAELPFKDKVAFFHRNRIQQWQPPSHSTAFQDYLTNPGLARLGGHTAAGVGRSLRNRFQSPDVSLRPPAALTRYLNSSGLPRLTAGSIVVPSRPSANSRALVRYLSGARVRRLGASGAISAKRLRNRFVSTVKAISRKQRAKGKAKAKTGHFHALRSRNSILRSGKRRMRG